ncbi:hypothetical protein BDV95DRAFT_591394 [Massariosphaeria phaeospora]|uniref:Uncharacterized protein n=1 Tax=Massariosphaeria phaeospora TaxID=100035 RepID=A0A7C8IG47_9PLEO|nr:hypothetical protein BDV95DRAFT_591394 [Massariosphaeria phaeospora]
MCSSSVSADKTRRHTLMVSGANKIPSIQVYMLCDKKQSGIRPNAALGSRSPCTISQSCPKAENICFDVESRRLPVSNSPTTHFALPNKSAYNLPTRRTVSNVPVRFSLLVIAPKVAYLPSMCAARGAKTARRLKYELKTKRLGYIWMLDSVRATTSPKLGSKIQMHGI